MKRIFVSHPYNDNPELNKKEVTNICRYIIRKNMLPISPIHLFSTYEFENKLIRKNILEACFDLIDICDEVWVFGDSMGCVMEEEYAEDIGKKVVLFYENNNT